jgi:phospholipid-binding lipoprotein MlaA
MNISLLTRLSATLAVGALLAGCAAPKTPDARDPLESFNRGVYSFNETVDHALLRPVARGYVKVTPEPVRTCIHNMFNNLGDVWSATNSFLQGRPRDGINTVGRFLTNTTLGVGGCIDFASTSGARRIPNDFGTTLGVWGIGPGPYLVLPVLGSSTVRDGIGRIVDFEGNPVAVSQIDNVRLRNSLWGLELLDTRADLLQITDTIDRVALDPYSFVRDAYLQRRAARIVGRDKNASAAALPDYGDDPGTTVPNQGGDSGASVPNYGADPGTTEPAMPAVKQNPAPANAK